jgi:hypothetical protein
MGGCVQGFDIAQGTTVLKAGERVGAAEIGLIASIGVVYVKVDKIRLTSVCKHMMKAWVIQHIIHPS